jgi:hypothetical protein
MLRTLRACLDNPVFLRDLGWAYYPPLFGRIPRKEAQFVSAAVIFFGILTLVLYAEARHPGAGPLILWLFAGIGFAVMIPRSLISGIQAWQTEREFQTVNELVLTGMTAREFAVAKVFARGFVFVVGGLLLALLALIPLVWSLLAPSLDLPFGRARGAQLAIVVAAILLAPALLSQFYLRMLRIGLRGRMLVFRALLSGLWWFVLAPVLTLLYFFILTPFALRVDLPIEHLVALFLWVLLPAFWMLTLACFRALVSEIESHYRAAAEA